MKKFRKIYMPGTQLFYMRGLEISASWSSQYTQASAGALEQTDVFLTQLKLLRHLNMSTRRSLS